MIWHLNIEVTLQKIPPYSGHFFWRGAQKVSLDMSFIKTFNVVEKVKHILTFITTSNFLFRQ